MRAFIVRPFGTKSGIDFDRVDGELIGPALDALGITGRTTAEIVAQGNIRTDMFQRLLTADLVVADLSIHNANVFYELGIRHALRDKRTFLLRCRGDEVPFDLKTDRYLSYDKDDPAASVEELTRALRSTLDGDRADSPVFQLLPGLAAQDPKAFQVVPMEFTETVDAARQKGHTGDLGLFAEEVTSLGVPWESTGLRAVGRAQFALKAWEAARTTWEGVRSLDRDDFEANRHLATIYQRLGDLQGSEAAIQRALKLKNGKPRERAELQSLLGSNAKTLWQADWRDQPKDDRRQAALRSPHLGEAIKAYSNGFSEDLNHFYSGLNAGALQTLRLELAAAEPEVWAEFVDEDDDPDRALARATKERDEILAAVAVSLDAARHRGEFDIWARISVADLACLRARSPQRVAAEYRQALAQAKPFEASAARRQLEMYSSLGVLADKVQAALAAVDERAPREPSAASPGPARIIVFSGHRLDAPGRATPRFPAAAEGKARAMIREAVAKVQAKAEGGNVTGIAGGASGGDILFHEVCAELGIATTLYLAVPRDLYVKASVADGGPEWVERFDRLLRTLPTRVLADSLELPRWTRDGSKSADYSIWERNNRWTLHNALAGGAANATLVVLWNGERGDGPGGTADMVETAKQRGALVERLDAKKLLTTD